MTIDKEKLIELLIEKTGFEKEQVEQQLSELVNRIHKAAGEGKSFEIEGFGIFHVQNEQLHFEPSDDFQTEINHKYAGMEPIELIAAFKEAGEEDEEGDEDVPENIESSDTTTDPDPEPEPEPQADEHVQGSDEVEEKKSATEEDIWGLEASSLEEEIFKARMPEEEEPPEAEDPKKEPESIMDMEEQEQETGLYEEKEGEPADEYEEDPDLVEFKPEKKTVKEASQVSEGEKTDSKAKKEATETSIETETKPKWEPAPELREAKEKDPIGRILVVFLVITVVGVGTWFAYDMGLFSGLINLTNKETVNPVHTSDVNQESGQNQSGITPGETQSTGTSQNQVQPDNDSQSDVPLEPTAQNEVAKNETDQTGQSVYGLRGDYNPNAKEGFTIVVHSLRSETKARNIADNLSLEGYRTNVSQAVVGGTEYWRIGLGQFETVRKAMDTASGLREPFRNNFFIKRIQ